MKSVSTKFTDTLGRKAINVKRQVYYKRRYWVAGSSSYTWESSWTLLPETVLVSVSPITSQLDTQTQNSFNISSVTLVLANLQKQWRPDNKAGYFAPDSGSVLGYEPYWTKVQIRAGIVYDDQTSEIVTLFTGVATGLNFSASQGTVQITVSGLQALLLKSNAESVSTTSTSENLGTGNGSTTVFSTANKGVGIFKGVYLAGVLKTAGIDYTTGKINDAANFAQVTFIVAPGSGVAVTATYVYWYQLQKFETLVSLLLTQGNIPSGNQQVSSVVFPGNITNTHVWQTQADWNGGSSLPNIDTATIPNSIETKYSDVQTWLASTSGWTTDLSGGGTFNNDGTGVDFTGVATGGCDSSAYRAMTGSFGTWQLSFLENVAHTGISFTWALMFGAYTSPKIYKTAYTFKINVTSGSVYSITMSAVDGSGSAVVSQFGSVTRVANTQRSLKIIRRSLSTFYVYLDGSLIMTFVDSVGQYATSTYTGLTVSFPPSTASDVWKFISAPTMLTAHSTASIASWTSSSVDFSATPSAWSSFLSAQTLNSGAVLYYTRGSPDNSTWDSWVVVSGGVIGSTLRRYLQVRADLDITNGDPVVASITVGALTASTVITLANFSGLTVYDAITQIAALANYEFGFDAAENFFFRQKKLSSTPLMTLDHTNYLSDILSLTPGYDLVYSGVRATYGAYTSEIDDAAGTAAAPTARFGYALYQPGSGSFLIPADANLAANIAQNLFNYYNLPRRRVKVSTKFLPQIDLSDVVQLSFLDNGPHGMWYWGAPFVTWGSTAYYYYGNQGNFGDIENLVGKVIGYRIDTDQWSCEMDLEEVI